MLFARALPLSRERFDEVKRLIAERKVAQAAAAGSAAEHLAG